MAEVITFICKRCGISMEMNAGTLDKRMSRDAENANLCRDCLGIGVVSECRAWAGDVDPDTFAPIHKGKPYKPGIRLCGKADCVRRDHIVKPVDDYKVQLKKTKEANKQPCLNVGCGRPVHAIGKCMMHYRRDLRAYGSHQYNRISVSDCLDAYVAQARGQKVCGVDGCDNKHRSKGLCEKHYRRLYVAVGRFVSEGKAEFV